MNKKVLLSLLVVVLGALAMSEKISFSAKSMNGKSGDKESPTTLNGSAKVATESIEIEADSIKLSGEDFRYINAEGDVSGKNSETKTDFKCRKLSYDRQTKVAVLEGNVEFTDTENEVTALAGIIEYDQDKEVAIMQINVNLKQKDNVCTSAHAIYRKTEQLLEMNGNPQIIQNDDTFRAQTIVLDMNTQEITLMGNVQGSVTTGEGEESTEEAETEAPPAEQEPPEAEELNVREAPDESEEALEEENTPEEPPEPSK